MWEKKTKVKYVPIYHGAVTKARRAGGELLGEFIAQGVGTDLSRWSSENVDAFISRIVQTYIDAADTYALDDEVPF